MTENNRKLYKVLAPLFPDDIVALRIYLNSEYNDEGYDISLQLPVGVTAGGVEIMATASPKDVVDAMSRAQHYIYIESEGGYGAPEPVESITILAAEAKD